MGGAEAVPFADKAKAEAFARDHGGTVVAFDAIPADYILSAHDAAEEAEAAEPDHHHDAGHDHAD